MTSTLTLAHPRPLAGSSASGYARTQAIRLGLGPLLRRTRLRFEQQRQLGLA